MLAVSIICPVYKAESYLHRCVDSVLSQTFEDFELLLIDDGSPDNSGKICDEYAQKDKRVRVFHKENGGVAAARQLGLENATGEYTIHVDPDDWVEPNMLEELYAKAKAEDADMVICDYYKESLSRTRYMRQKPTKLEADTILRYILRGKLYGALWNKLIRRECFTLYNIDFPENISLWEDMFVCCSLLLNDIKIAYLNKAFYHYDYHSNAESIVRTNHEKGTESQIIFISHFQDKLDSNRYVEELYSIKAVTKDKMFRCPSYSKDEFTSLYSEINERYKKDRRQIRSPRFHAAMALKFNNRMLPYYIYRIWRVILPYHYHRVEHKILRMLKKR